MLRPYMWIRCTYMPVRCSHYINISISAALSRVLIGGRVSAAFLFIALEHLPLIEGGSLQQEEVASSNCQGDYWQYIAEGLSANGQLLSQRH